MSKKTLLLIVSLVLALGLTMTGTLAYLTDRDTDTNVFTVGNVDIDLTEDFEQGSELIPGEKIDKVPVITNTGDNDAWVWMTVAIPAGMESDEGASKNLLHWNWMAGTDADYMNAKDQAAIDEYIAKGWLPEGTTIEQIRAGQNWDVEAEIPVGVEEIDGVEYNVYLFKHNIPLKPGETTLGSFCQVYMDTRVDIDPEGNLAWVENGVATELGYNINTMGNPKVYVAAYAIQAEGFDTVDDAYNAYGVQWGENGGVQYASVTEVTDSDALAKAIEEAAGKSAIIQLAEGEYTTNFKIAGGSDIVIIGSGEDTVLAGQIASTTSEEGSITLSNLTYKVDDTIVDSTGISQTGKSAIALWGNQKAVVTNVTFDMSLADSSAITAWWDTGVGTSIVVKDCTFNCNGQRPIRATGNVTVEDTTFNDPYRYAVQLTAKADTATLLDKAIINFKNNTIVNGENGKAFVYGIQLEGETYGCNDCVINGSGNTIVDGGADSTMYYCECGKVVHETIEWNVETTPVHEN